MEVLSSLFPNFSQIFYISYLFVFHYYGWVIFVIGVIYALWRLYIVEIRHQYVHQQEWTFLHIKAPRENLVSSLAVEGIFSQMHSLHGGKTPVETYVEGQIQLWYSLEIVSLGGKISFVLRIPTKMKDIVESAFYAHYPQAEIVEVEDYMSNFKYDPYNPGEYEIFGWEWKLEESDVIPIKTYKDFEHPSAEEKIIDPLANFFESLAKIQPYELIAYQIIIQPLADDEWQPKGLLKVKQLTGEEIPHKASFWDFLMTPFNAFAKLSYKEALIGHKPHENENKPKNNWMSMTETEKERVNLIEKKVGKQGYKTKIRTLYIVPKDKFDNSRKPLMSGVYRPLGSVMTNKLKPNVNKWTGVEAVVSKSFEQPFIDAIVKRRKKYFFKGFKNRDIHLGSPMFVLNTEEITTLYHFPITTKTTFAPAAVEKTESKKSQAPANLPVAEG
jgi:hypothetical protein